MNKTFIRTNNYNGVVAAVDALVNRDPSLHGLGLFYGQWGYGKTEIVEQYYGISDTFYIRMMRKWATRRLLEELCEIMKLGAPVYRLDRTVDQVIAGFRRWRKPLFVDEGDYLFQRGGEMLDVIVDIFDAARVPIIIIGMESIYERLQKHGKFFSRILPAGIVEFKPVSPPEIMLVTKEWTGLSIGYDGAELLCRYISGDFRYLVGYLVTLEGACRTNGTTQITPKMVETVVNKAEKITKKMYGIENHKNIRILGKPS